MSGCEQISISGNIGDVAMLSDGRFVTVTIKPELFDDFDDLGRERPERWTTVRSSRDGGVTWTEPVRGFPYSAGKGVPMPVVLAADHRDRIHSFGLRFFGIGRDGLPWHSVVLHAASDDGGATWSAAKEVDFGHQYTGALNGVLTMDTGRILLPLSYLAPERPNGQYVSMAVYSDDGGETWQSSNDCAVDSGGVFYESGAVEPVVVQLRSGLVWMVIRTTTGYFWESFSTDGAVWTPPRPTRIVSSNAPAGVLRLTDGRIVLVWNNLYGEPMRDGGISYARQLLHAAISVDDAQTWSVPKVVARVEEGDLPKAQTTYPHLSQAADGAILLIYHRINARPGPGDFRPIRELLRIDPEWLAS